jgi:Raf kinase inhibitor-like YbhB/YbcL family protein
MKRGVGIGLVIVGIIIVGVYLLVPKRTEKTPEPSPMATANIDTMNLTSIAFENGGKISKKYTCNGGDESPPLTISGVSEATRDLALIVHDPDVPSGDFTHWLVWNISPKTTKIAEGTVPAGAVQGVNSFGESNYGGPCPPAGTHHYIFELYALDMVVNLPSSSDRPTLESAIQGHIINKTSLTGIYSKE